MQEETRFRSSAKVIYDPGFSFSSGLLVDLHYEVTQFTFLWQDVALSSHFSWLFHLLIDRY